MALLVAIGVFEARESARQISELAGPLRITPSGAGLSGVGFVASCAIYLALGWRAPSGRDAIRAGALVGLLSGLIGGTLRSLVIAGVVADAVRRYAAAPDWFVPVALGIFVVASMIVSTGAGAALAFIGVRLARAIRSEPSRPPA